MFPPCCSTTSSSISQTKPFVGREEALKALKFNQVFESVHQVTVLAGPHDCGKTALVRKYLSVNNTNFALFDLRGINPSRDDVLDQMKKKLQMQRIGCCRFLRKREYEQDTIGIGPSVTVLGSGAGLGSVTLKKVTSTEGLLDQTVRRLRRRNKGIPVIVFDEVNALRNAPTFMEGFRGTIERLTKQTEECVVVLISSDNIYASSFAACANYRLMSIGFVNDDAVIEYLSKEPCAMKGEEDRRYVCRKVGGLFPWLCMMKQMQLTGEDLRNYVDQKVGKECKEMLNKSFIESPESVDMECAFKVLTPLLTRDGLEGDGSVGCEEALIAVSCRFLGELDAGQLAQARRYISDKLNPSNATQEARVDVIDEAIKKAKKALNDLRKYDILHEYFNIDPKLVPCMVGSHVAESNVYGLSNRCLKPLLG